MSTTQTADLTITFNARRCIHARKCVLGLPASFVPEKGRDWIQPDGATTEELVAVINACPSGALSYTRKDGGSEEAAPEVNTARLWEHGPLEVHGPMEMPDGTTRLRTLLCRCGASKTKPYCDNSHLKMRFKATGEVPTDEAAETLEERGGPLKLEAFEDGPACLTGPLEIIAGSGRRVTTTTKAYLCRCGASANKPFCDGSHKKIGFETE